MSGKGRVDAETALRVAKSLCTELEPATVAITIAGSLRRQKPQVGDIELLAIPRFEHGITNLLEGTIQRLIAEGILTYRLNKNGSKVFGAQNKLLIHRPSNISVDIFTTDAERWPVSLVVRTGGTETNKLICLAAIRRGWRFQPYGKGFVTPDGYLRCYSEQEVFEAVGLRYREPWERD